MIAAPQPAYVLRDRSGHEVPVDAAQFNAAALDPAASVVIEACAGSGKTWLLVARIVRALLAGCAPAEILAITFTRRAANEMRARLTERLTLLATADDDAVLSELRSLAVPDADVTALLARARGLLELVLEAEPGPTIETFHGWFMRLLALAPLAAGVPRELTPAEQPGVLRDAAWRAFNDALLEPAYAGVRAAYELLVAHEGAHGAAGLLRELLLRHADIQLALDVNHVGAASLRIDFALTDAHPDGHPARTLREDVELIAALRAHLADLAPFADLRQAQDFVAAAEPLLGASAAASDDEAMAWIAALRAALFTQKGEPKALQHVRKRLEKEPQRWTELMRPREELCARLRRCELQLQDRAACARASAALQCFGLLAACYRDEKAAAGAIDFADLELFAARLMRDEALAAAVQVRLDARYRQVLVDEMQDTNPLQWQVLQAWLAAYGRIDAPSGGSGADGRPAVFLVGDPKQSIYRFRRAEPRLFALAADWLAADFGARRLRTDHTRRSAPPVIDAVNRALAAHPLLLPHTTHQRDLAGRVLLLPPPSPAAPAERVPDRDPLTQPAEVDEARSALLVGRNVARTLHELVGRTIVTVEENGRRVTRPACAGDAMLLVRARTHLTAYERALREAGLPYVSSRPGGLLDTLEAEDLHALLTFLVTPFDDLSLAHALRTPLLGCTDDDLLCLAASGQGAWWERLVALGAQGPRLNEGELPPAPPTEVETPPVRLTDVQTPHSRLKEVAAPLARLIAARTHLQRWLVAAAVLPVHDLLDRIFFDTDAIATYAANVPPSLRERTVANLRAFLELALQIDAGRYPSLPRFLHALDEYRRGAEQEAPSEGLAATLDALRILTIHEAKGLEAPIVVLIASEPGSNRDYVRPLIVWPPIEVAPTHVSIIGRANERGAARAAWFAEEERLAALEDQNLLYVALTRARQVLVVAGTLVRGEPDAWYEQLAAALPECVQPPDGEQIASGGLAARGQVIDYRPAPLNVGSRGVAVSPDATDSEPQLLGRALHRLLEWAVRSAPPRIVRGEQAAAALGLTPAQTQRVRAATRLVLQAPALAAFFDAARFSWAASEIELLVDDDVHRPDRVVRIDGTLWVLDFKWQLLDSERADYREQLARYAGAARRVWPDAHVRSAVVTADGELHEGF